MMMCRFTHPLAGTGTISWPNFASQRRAKTVQPNLPGPFWNDPLAKTAESEASVGRELEVAGILSHKKYLD
jgi:hypothetical protein